MLSIVGAILIACGLCFAVGLIAWKVMFPPLCDNCEHLIRKERKRNSCAHRYSCRRTLIGFDYAPEICSCYEPKERETDGRVH